MNRNHTLLTLLAVVLLASCGTKQGDTKQESTQPTAMEYAERMRAMATGNDADANFIIISKETMTLSLYDGDMRLISCFPVAMGKEAGDKQEAGDRRTPEGKFSITAIEPAAHWAHDFGDGRGAVTGAYGNWFIRFDTPHQGIGIHGTMDESIIGRRATEGSIVLRSNDLDSLRAMICPNMSVEIEPLGVVRDLEPEVIAEVEPEVAETTTPEEVVAVEEPKPAVERSPEVAPRESGDEVWHTVVDGDLVGRIAKHYGVSLAEIKRLNPNLDVDRIAIGQRIKVRGGAAATTTTELSTPTAEVWHTIAEGELVGRIAKQYGVSLAEIKRLNPNLDVDRVAIGQRIRIR